MILAVIPARYDSSRFPGKPLSLLAGKPLIQWVYEGTVSCSSLDDVVVATDDDRIAAVVRSFGGKSVMTCRSHTTGTDRAAQVASGYPDAEVIVNVQGDQPLINASVIASLIEPFRGKSVPDMSTIACPIDSEFTRSDSNSVKVACDQQGYALFFSRASLPYFRNQIDVPVYHHIGLYAFRASFLQQYATLQPTPLEQCEALEQLRVLEHGYRIRVALVDRPLLEVNTPDDLARVEQWLQRNASGH